MTAAERWIRHNDVMLIFMALWIALMATMVAVFPTWVFW
jgi:hypothetical protein